MMFTVLLCRHNSGMLGEDSAAEDIDMADAEQQVLLGPQSIWTPAVSPLISVDPFCSPHGATILASHAGTQPGALGAEGREQAQGEGEGWHSQGRSKQGT